MKAKTHFLILFLITGLVACNPAGPDPGEGTDFTDPAYGAVDFDFALPELSISQRGIHRVDLSLSKSVDSLYRKEYISCANVSDFQQKYTFNLLPGRYYYHAVVNCTFQGDSCMNAGFPGGKYGLWWSMGWVDIEKGKRVTKNIHFQ